MASVVPLHTALDGAVEIGDGLDATLAAEAFAALGSEQRIEVLRALVRAGEGGLAVGSLRDRLDIAPSTLSHHLKFLAAAELIEQERVGRSIICRAAYDRLRAVAAFLTRECCADSADDACETEVGA